jgi:Putative MetA-pathway of phenol degradation
MNARFASSILIAVLVATARVRQAQADPWLLAPGDHYSAIGGSYFSADSYHSSEGTRMPLDGGGLHEEKSLFSYNEFGWSKGRTLILGFPFKSVTQRGGSPADGNGRTETGFGDLQLGVRVGLREGPSALSIEADWLPPLGYDRYLKPPLGDGASSLQGRLQYGAPIGSRGFYELEGGYRMYIDKLAPTNQTLTGATLGFWVGKSVLLAGNYQGHIGGASKDTSWTALPGAAVPGTTNDQVTTHLVGPMLLYRVDDRFDVIIGSMHTASAKNAFHMDQLYVSLALKQSRLSRLQGLAGTTRNP